STDVRKMWSSQMAGVAPACPGRGTRHTTFSVELQVVAKPVSEEIPFPRGPLHAGQFSARSDPHAVTVIEIPKATLHAVAKSFLRIFSRSHLFPGKFCQGEVPVRKRAPRAGGNSSTGRQPPGCINTVTRFIHSRRDGIHCVQPAPRGSSRG